METLLILNLFAEINSGEKPIYTKCEIFSNGSLTRSVFDIPLCRKSDLSRSRDILQQRAWLSWTYHAVGRSGEVQFLEFSDTVYDPFFHAAVPLWMEPKTLQKYSQIMVHTKYSCGSYLVDPYHSLGSYWAVEDGLYRSNSNASSTSGFYFPQLHSLRSDRVSSKITAAIRSSIEDKTIAKKYSGRSLRKGSSTELRMHRDISEAETIARSGHATGSNIDKYIDRFNPTLNLPGAMALAGYSECHRIPSPPRFSAIGDYVMEDVQRLIDELFVISVPAMKRGGDLRPFLVSTAASMVMYHCDIKKDFGLHHPIVTKLEDAASKAKITDGASPSPSTTGVLEFWSKKILSDFIAKNDECDLSFGCPDKTMQLLSKVSTLTSTVSNLVSMTQNISSQNVVLQTTLTSFLDVASSLNHHLRDVTTTRRTPTPRKSKNMALYQGIDGDESSFLSELDKELSDDMPTRDPEYVPDETTAAGVQIFDNSQSCDVPNARTINEALQFTAHDADVNKADLKGITIRSLVEQFYSAQLFHHSNSKTGMKNFTLPILQGDSKNRTKILSVVELVEFCTSDAQYQSLKKGDLTREEVKKIADEIELRVLSKINELAGVTKSRRKPLVLGIGTYLRGQMNERKVASLEALFP